ncbi:SDR family oxidoreductase [Azospirillum sp. RWY-5-1]|uniref:SDR family oxidoreductase n=1 Tax=Azospirillum oleiclasticum TaxID=2735135 RepID=A0ABX2TBZ3_9PROT|nr:SDR family oxidoreductase [Azospirillum oleiclasticum]NYZ16917.1 SDR family oxidoreductase [Azospirillum oleiclasticum]NYZ21854.1 SDR family oxidoreductase [Azospirillum oleiclasticum]
MTGCRPAGAASGIGRTAAQHFAQLGMKLVLFDTDGLALNAVATGLGGEFRTLAGDVSRPAALERLRDPAPDAFGAMLGEFLGDTGADATRTAGDHGGLAG